MKLAIRIPLALGCALTLALGVSSVATAAGTTYTATLAPVPLNGATGASGTLTLVLDGNTATITEHVSGLAATFNGGPFPHVQHIHGGGMGTCPLAAADTNGDGVISTTEGGPAYGGILTTLSVSGGTTPAQGTDIKIAPSGASFDYSRTITLSDATVKAIQAGNAVIVVHGLDPATAPPAATSTKSALLPTLPLAATAPALCGPLTLSTAMTNPATPNGMSDGSFNALTSNPNGSDWLAKFNRPPSAIR